MTLPAGADGTLSAAIEVDGRNVANAFRDALEDAERDTDRDQVDFGRRVGRNVNRGFRSNVFTGLGAVMAARLATGVVTMRRGFRRIGTSIVGFVGEGIQGSGQYLSQIFRSMFAGIQQTIGPILGSLFNVSGRSPATLIFIITLISSLIFLILGLIHGVRVLMSLLAVIPNLLFAIALQGAALIFIFNGFFEAIGNLAAAKNIQELNEALKDTNPAMAAVIRSLWPFKEFFKEISEAAKTAFFSQLADTFAYLYQQLKGFNEFLPGIVRVATGLGNALNTIFRFFGSEQFNKFLGMMAGETEYWLIGFGNAMVAFLRGLTTFGQATLPYVRWFGEKFNEWIASIGRWFERLANPDEGFIDWLEKAKSGVKIFMDTLGEIWTTIKVIAQNIADTSSNIWGSLVGDPNSGDNLLKDIKQAFFILNEVFRSPVGKQAMQGFIRFLKIFFVLLVAVIIGITDLFAIFNVLFEMFKLAAEGIWIYLQLVWAGWQWIGGRLAGFFIWLYRTVLGWLISLNMAWMNFKTWVISIITSVRDWFIEKFWDIINFAATLADKIFDALIGFKDRMKQLGRDLWQGFIDGVKEKFWELVQWLRDHIDYIPLSNHIFGPVAGTVIQHLPASQAAGGTPVAAVAADAARQSQNLIQARGSSSNVALESGAIQVNFQSTLPPTQQQAKEVAQTVSAEYLTLVTKLATRTM